MEDGFSCIPFVSACQWQNKDGDYKQCTQCTLDIQKKPFISTPVGNDYINDGDWIIIEANGRRYPCDPDIFEVFYEPVDPDDISIICEHLHKIHEHNPDDVVEQLLDRIKSEIMEFL